MVGFVQLHRTGAPARLESSRVVDNAALRELCDVLAASIFVRRAFALNRGQAAPSRTSTIASLLSPSASRRSSFSSRRASPDRGLTDGRTSPTRGLLDGWRRSTDGRVPARNRFGGLGGSCGSLRDLCEHASLAGVTLDELALSADADRATLLDWGLDPWALSDAEVRRLCVVLLHSLGLLEHFRISHATVVAFVAALAARYNDQPFRAHPCALACRLCCRARAL